jgi:hypothetical protein
MDAWGISARLERQYGGYAEARRQINAVLAFASSLRTASITVQSESLRKYLFPTLSQRLDNFGLPLLRKRSIPEKRCKHSRINQVLAPGFEVLGAFTILLSQRRQRVTKAVRIKAVEAALSNSCLKIFCTASAVAQCVRAKPTDMNCCSESCPIAVAGNKGSSFPIGGRA